MEKPDITIVMSTYFPKDDHTRYAAACAALSSWTLQKNFKYDGVIRVHIADDGTEEIRLQRFIAEFSHRVAITYSVGKRQGVGASLNRGFKNAGDGYVLYLCDDWALVEKFDLNPWVQLLEERAPEIGMVRLGPAHPNLTGTINPMSTAWNGWAMKLHRYSFAYGHRPALYHPCFYQYYGLFKENCSAIDCEEDYAQRFTQNFEGPDIVLALPHPFQHVESLELGYLDPKENK